MKSWSQEIGMSSQDKVRTRTIPESLSSPVTFPSALTPPTPTPTATTTSKTASTSCELRVSSEAEGNACVEVEMEANEMIEKMHEKE